MDPNPFNGNNTYPGHVPAPAPYVSPLHEALLPFYNPVMNTYPQTPLPELLHQDQNYIPINENRNFSAYVPPTTVIQATVPGHPGSGNNYLMNNFILDTSANMNPNSFMTSADRQASGPEIQDANIQIFQCEKCPSRFYSRQAFGGHMSSHSKLAKKKGNMSQEMMAKTDNEGSNYASASASAASKKRGRKKGNNAVVDHHEPKTKKQV